MSFHDMDLLKEYDHTFILPHEIFLDLRIKFLKILSLIVPL